MLRLLLISAAFTLLAACTPGSSTTDQPPTSFGEVAISLVTAVNEERRSGATCGDEYYPSTRPLALEHRLVRAAELHTADMVARGYFSHTGHDGSTVGQRVSRQGYEWRAVGENIAWGQRSVEQVMGAWMQSPGHCRAIMNGDFSQLGAARVENHWTLVFGTPR